MILVHPIQQVSEGTNTGRNILLGTSWYIQLLALYTNQNAQRYRQTTGYANSRSLCSVY